MKTGEVSREGVRLSARDAKSGNNQSAPSNFIRVLRIQRHKKAISDCAYPRSCNDFSSNAPSCGNDWDLSADFRPGMDRVLATFEP